MRILSILIISFLFISCSSSKKYYEPQSLEKISPIKHKETKLPKEYRNYKIINENDDYLIISSPDGFLKIFNNNELIFNNKFTNEIVAASLQNEQLAMLSALNEVIIYDTNNMQNIYSQNFGQYYGVTQEIANPIFNDNLLISPTLDGKIAVISLINKQLIRTINVGTKDSFDNITYLKAQDDILVAASSSKILTIANNNSFNKLINIKKVLNDGEFLIVFTNDGSIIKYDFYLNEIASTKLKYANYTDAYLYGDFVYCVEYCGYLIKLNKNLELQQVYNLKSKIKTKAYFTDDMLFYNSKAYKLQ